MTMLLFFSLPQEAGLDSHPTARQLQENVHGVDIALTLDWASGSAGYLKLGAAVLISVRCPALLYRASLVFRVVSISLHL